MQKWQIHPLYKSAFGYKVTDPKLGEFWKIVGHLERWPGWEERLARLLEAVNNADVAQSTERILGTDEAAG